MNIQLPAKIQTAFDNYRSQGTLGAGAEKSGPEMDMLNFTSFRANMEDMQDLVKLDQTGADLETTPNQILCSAAGIQQLGKPFLKTLEAVVEGPLADPDSVLIHKGDGESKESFEFFTAVQGCPTILTATFDGQETCVGANRMLIENGAPVLGDMGMPKFESEFLLLK